MDCEKIEGIQRGRFEELSETSLWFIRWEIIIKERHKIVPNCYTKEEWKEMSLNEKVKYIWEHPEEYG